MAVIPRSRDSDHIAANVQVGGRPGGAARQPGMAARTPDSWRRHSPLCPPQNAIPRGAISGGLTRCRLPTCRRRRRPSTAAPRCPRHAPLWYPGVGLGADRGPHEAHQRARGHVAAGAHQAELRARAAAPHAFDEPDLAVSHLIAIGGHAVSVLHTRVCWSLHANKCRRGTTTCLPPEVPCGAPPACVIYASSCAPPPRTCTSVVPGQAGRSWARVHLWAAHVGTGQGAVCQHERVPRHDARAPQTHSGTSCTVARRSLQHTASSTERRTPAQAATPLPTSDHRPPVRGCRICSNYSVSHARLSDDCPRQRAAGGGQGRAARAEHRGLHRRLRQAGRFPGTAPACWRWRSRDCDPRPSVPFQARVAALLVRAAARSRRARAPGAPRTQPPAHMRVRTRRPPAM